MALAGSLDLVCARDDRGRSSLIRQSFSAPIYLSKPYWDGDGDGCGGTLLVNVLNPTPGFFAGDTVECRVRVESGASLLLTSPSASRAHTMRHGEARLHQCFEVAEGGRLDFFPAMFIPQRGAAYVQKTSVMLEPGAEALFFEMLAPGRAASGEVYAFERLHWDAGFTSGGRLVARERYTLTSESPQLTALRSHFPTPYYASCYVFSPRLHGASPCWEAIHELHGTDVWVGVSGLVGGAGWAIKLVCGGSVEMHRAITTIRETLYRSMGSNAPSLRRV